MPRRFRRSHSAHCAAPPFALSVIKEQCRFRHPCKTMQTNRNRSPRRPFFQAFSHNRPIFTLGVACVFGTFTAALQRGMHASTRKRTPCTHGRTHTSADARQRVRIRTRQRTHPRQRAQARVTHTRTHARTHAHTRVTHTRGAPRPPISTHRELGGLLRALQVRCTRTLCIVGANHALRGVHVTA